jgi:hypothetical protein
MTVAAFVQLPLDTGNTGKKKRTYSRTVGADTVHEDVVLIGDVREVTGKYKVCSGVVTIAAAAQNGTTTAFGWLYNPVGSTIHMQVSMMKARINFTALAVDLLVGEIRANRFTFTGVNSGAVATPAKINSGDAANQGNMTAAFATAVPTLGAVLDNMLLPTMDLVTGGAGHWNPYIDDFDPSEEHEEIILKPGEGIVVWNAAAVTTANRRMVFTAAWDEFTP